MLENPDVLMVIPASSTALVPVIEEACTAGINVIILDADERFRGQNPGAIRQHLVRGPHWPYEALMLNVINTRLDGGLVSFSFDKCRIIFCYY